MNDSLEECEAASQMPQNQEGTELGTHTRSFSEQGVGIIRCKVECGVEYNVWATAGGDSTTGRNATGLSAGK